MRLNLNLRNYDQTKNFKKLIKILIRLVLKMNIKIIFIL